MKYTYMPKKGIKPKKVNKYKNMKLRIPQQKPKRDQKVNSFDGANIVEELLNIKAERKKAPKVVNNPLSQEAQKTINQMRSIKARDDQHEKNGMFDSDGQMRKVDTENYFDENDDEEEDDVSQFNGKDLHDRKAIRDLINQNDSEVQMRKGWCYKCNKQLKISLFWEEKIVLFIEYLQLLGLTITMFYQTWPQKLRRQARWLMLFNLDFLSYKHGLHKFVEDYDLVFFNSLGWALALGILTGFFLLLKFFKVISLINSRAPHCCVRWISNILQLLIMPILINTLPYGFYTFSTQRVDINEVNVWQKNEQFILLILAALVCAVLMLGFILMCCHIRKYAIYYTNDKHEQFVKQKELEYTLNISNLWRFKHFYLFSSFRRNMGRVYHRNLKWVFFWFSLVLSHSAMIMIFAVGLNIFLALSRALGVRSALLIDQNISYVLYTLNGIAIFFIIVLVIIFAVVKKWTWPLNEEYILQNVKRYMRYVKKFKEARSLIQRIHIKEGNFLKNEARLNYTIENYQRLYEEIKNDFEHILNQLVLEMLEELRLAKMQMQKDRKDNDGKVPPSVEQLLQLQLDSRRRVLQ